MSTMKRFVRDEKGASLVEYIILVGIVALIAFGGFKYFGQKVHDQTKAQGDSVGQVQSTLNQN